MYRSFLIAASSLVLAGGVLAQDRTPAPDGSEVFLYKLRNADKLEARIVTMGATLIGMDVPDRGVPVISSGVSRSPSAASLDDVATKRASASRRASFSNQVASDRPLPPVCKTSGARLPMPARWWTKRLRQQHLPTIT